MVQVWSKGRAIADLPTPITCKSGGFEKKSPEKPGD